jgi:hypothetical protein
MTKAELIEKLTGLTGYELRVMVCSECRSGDHLYKDAHGIFCRRCGPSVPVTTKALPEGEV